MIKLLLLAAPVLLVALSALPGYLIKRADRRGDAHAIGSFRDDLAPPAPVDAEQAALDERWAEFWADRDAEFARSPLRARLLTPYEYESGETIAQRFEAEREAIDARFKAECERARRDLANALGGWADDIEREAARWYAKAHGSPRELSHMLAVEIAESTQTCWDEEDARMLREHIEREEGARI